MEKNDIIITVVVVECGENSDRFQQNKNSLTKINEKNMI